MNSTRSKLGVFEYALLYLAVFALPAELALAQEAKGVIPANATAKTYGNGWECDRGYRKIDSACVVVTLPENAYLTDSSYGSGWTCKHGYKKIATRAIWLHCRQMHISMALQATRGPVTEAFDDSKKPAKP
jgi:hypothetical protein